MTGTQKKQSMLEKRRAFVPSFAFLGSRSHLHNVIHTLELRLARIEADRKTAA